MIKSINKKVFSKILESKLQEKQVPVLPEIIPDMVDAVLNTMKNNILNQKKIEIRGFGGFIPKKYNDSRKKTAILFHDFTKQ